VSLLVLRTQIHYENDGADVDRNTVRKVRHDLHLSESDGVDSAIFYDAVDPTPAFIDRYRHTLDRLAKD
jgi:hypothetical protein